MTLTLLKTPASGHTPSLSMLAAATAEDVKRVDALILEKIKNEAALIPDISRHIIASGGKRLRPALTLLSARLCGYAGHRHIGLAACVEFIHTATLLHDDVVDESTLRRGTPTANELWGNKASVLVGDYLLGLAFQLMVDDQSLKTLRILADAAAVIAQGEVMQLMNENEPETVEADYFKVITAKTATLFAAACELGAVVADRPDLEAPMREVGLNLGIAFQLVDDALDYSAKQATLGKTVGDDFRDGKITLPVILAYGRGTPEERQFWERTLRDQDIQQGDLEQALKLITRHSGLADTIARAEGYCEQARKSLALFPDSLEKDALLETIDFCTQRGY